MRCYENGDLYSYFEESMGVFCWRDIVDMLWRISAGLNVIHENNLIHGHLHGGNILVENEADSIDAKITDTGLHGPFDVSSQEIYGVIPFVAPEIFNGNTPSKESDIYSFGMIMWMASAGVRPYYNRPHDLQLVQEICSGLRPSAVDGTPPVFSKLMFECLDADPSKRPTASQLIDLLEGLFSTISNNPEEQIFPNLENQLHQEIHPQALYTSRFLYFPELINIFNLTESNNSFTKEKI